MMLKTEREKVLKYSVRAFENRLNSSTGGNLSIFNREKNLIAITPSGIDYSELKLSDIVIIDISGKVIEGENKPSSEVGFHTGLYKKRDDISSIVHTHSIYATTMACLNMEILPVHYLVGFSGKKVPIAPYCEFGSQELAETICKNIENYNAILLKNHGLVSLGDSIEKAYTTAEEIEFVARIYYQTQNIGKPCILSDEEMESVLKKFKVYGNKKR